MLAVTPPSAVGVGVDLLLREQRQQRRVARRAGRRIADGFAVHVGERLDRRIRWHEPIDLRLTGHFGRENAKRRAPAVTTDHSRDAARDQEVN
jgi:hypothetical protein